MKLIIKKDELINDLFVHWLIDRIKQDITLEADIRRLSELSNYFSEVTGDTISMIDVVMYAVNSIVCIKTADNYHITLPPTKKYRTTNYLIVTLVKFIDYGTNDIAGCRLFSSVLGRVTMNFDQYFAEYRNCMGV